MTTSAMAEPRTPLLHRQEIHQQQALRVIEPDAPAVGGHEHAADGTDECADIPTLLLGATAHTKR